MAKSPKKKKELIRNVSINSWLNNKLGTLSPLTDRSSRHFFKVIRLSCCMRYGLILCMWKYSDTLLAKSYGEAAK